MEVRCLFECMFIKFAMEDKLMKSATKDKSMKLTIYVRVVHMNAETI